MGSNKQNGIDDLISAAEYLEGRGYTSPDHLAVVGYSVGALATAAAVTQRPELFAAMYVRQGVVDPLRIAGSPEGESVVRELGSARDSTAFSYLYAYAPLEHVRPGVCYPSVLADVVDGDWRAAQSYDLVARLQSVQSCARPVLLYREPRAGDAAPDPAEVAADGWAFLARETGLGG
jgi:prolyl oligopeptidase